MSPRSTRPSRRSGTADDYRHVALVRVHELLKLGYQRLDPSAFRTSHEDAISGELADSIDDVLDSGAHEWVSYFSVHNEAPVRDRRRRGKQRRRVDIRIDSAERRPRTRFAFEAKPLDRAHGVKTYLGQVVEGRNWRRASLVDGLEHTYCSTHSRQSVGAPIDVYHTLLDFS